MGTSGAENSVEKHGFPMDKDKKRVRCKHCGKEVGGFSRLKHHLGGVGSDVSACVHVPADVRTEMWDALLGKKMDKLAKEVGELYHPDLPLKRKISFPSTSNGSGSVTHLVPNQPPLPKKGKNVLDPTPRGLSGTGGVPIIKREDVRVIVRDDSYSALAKCIGTFFYEAGVDLAAIELPSFQKMLDAAIRCGTGFKVPTQDDLTGWILQEDLEEVWGRVEGVKRSWAQTGCTILLDIWTDQRGRNLIGFLVDSLQGTIFLKSVDASNAIRDPDALASLLSRVIEDVGVQNVVQVISPDASCYMEAAGKILVEKYKLFWTVCADHCISLILERIESMDHVKEVLAKAKSITKFIYNNVLLLELMRKHIAGGELVMTSVLKSVSPFMTLENMVSKKGSLLSMLTSETWRASAWSTETKGKTICELVKDSTFWAAALNILKISTPFINILRQINRRDASPMGFIYDMMDVAKEELKTNLGGEETIYLPYWVMIDNIWDNYLHSPLHSAAYYLNPCFFYANSFLVDAEVVNGLLFCIVRMTEDRKQQQLIIAQLESYRASTGGFGEEMAVDQRSKVPPVIWWSLYGGQCPELQKLALRILGQTCSTAARYNVRKGGVSEPSHDHAQNFIERQRLSDVEFVRSNLRLWQPNQRESIISGDLGSSRDWIAEDA